MNDNAFPFMRSIFRASGGGAKAVLLVLLVVFVLLAAAFWMLRTPAQAPSTDVPPVTAPTPPPSDEVPDLYQDLQDTNLEGLDAELGSIESEL